MTPADIKRYHRELLSLKRRLGRDLTELEEEALRGVGGDASGSLSNVPLHPADLGTDNFEEEINLGLMENQEKICQDVLDALDRIQEGKFGRCEECAKPIPKERLNALPYARYCLEHAQQLSP